MSALGLRDGDCVELTALSAGLDESEPAAAMQRALLLLGYRARSRAEMVQALELDGYPQEVVETICARLEDTGLIDDERFVEEFVHAKIRASWGSRRIIRDLEAAGVPEDILQRCTEALTSDDTEYERATELAVKRASRQPDVAKLAAFLARRGFPAPVAWRAARSATDAITSRSQE